MTKPITNGASSSKALEADPGTDAVLRALQGIRFGSIEVVIHNGKIVQVERREKLRIDLGV